MVVWLFSGGGETEVRGLAPFLKKHFPKHTFERKSPIRRKPGSKPGQKNSGAARCGYGRTGKGLAKEIPKRLRDSLNHNEPCDIILIFDDLDCRDYSRQKKDCLDAVKSVERASGIKTYICFAAPEIEAWLIADWDHSFAKHPDFRQRHDAMRHWLRAEKKIPFDAPESFGDYDPKRGACDEKMSEAIIESTTLTPEDQFRNRYSKARHTPELLLDIEPSETLKRCPLFRDFYYYFNPVP